ncbi:sporulation protein YqfD [Clostridium sp. NSJ-145]|jgi:similar to stage IV sporulation protein|uniref:sporulation protein YqfD n=1 Tax=Clostridium sp. NSJ-145 TaxID=2897777 RepID=UPI001E2B0AC3|nr:sporulation protein YqfD [Clostridium sp. NSJ-145]MCD2502497.1 sporulation protein YqfD [Clostridium sp. NSJ-145]MDU6340755.1 sporulation protein YqfD [Clostridium sp.]
MGMNNIRAGRITVEIKLLNPDRILNIFWNRNINIYKINKKNISTIRLDIDYINYEEVCEVIQTLGGKISIVKRRGFIFWLRNMRGKISLVVGLMLFLVVIFLLSNYVWAIDINVQENISPFEIRQQLKEIGIKPGMAKSDIVVEDIEKKLENANSEILWLRVRVEGSTLNVTIEEKINPPTEWNGQYGNLVATEDGEVVKVYTYAGRSAVKQEQMVKKGDVLIEGIDGKEGQEYIIAPRGIVIANTFYEKTMQLKLTGTKLERSGERETEYYISIFGKKIYLKKAIKDFKEYDRIEKSGKIFNEVVYYERIEKEVDITEEEAEKIAIESLEESLKKDLTRDSKVVDKIVKKQLDSDGNLTIKVVFVVEKNIVNDIPVQY